MSFQHEAVLILDDQCIEVIGLKKEGSASDLVFDAVFSQIYHPE